MNNLSDQFEFLWQEIQAEERQCKGLKKEEEEDEEEELEEELLEELVACVSFLGAVGGIMGWLWGGKEGV